MVKRAKTPISENFHMGKKYIVFRFVCPGSVPNVKEL